MKIGLIDVDSKIANLALMKIAAYHRTKGDVVEWYTPFEEYDVVYMSKVFTFTPDYRQVIPNAKAIKKGGTGYGPDNHLPEAIDLMQPDYSIYKSWPQDTALGFLTRGCPNKCAWCIVPKKEGATRPYMGIEEVTQGYKYKRAVLMDNNILACRHYAMDQLAKIIEHGVRVDFNQGLDARLVDETFAEILARVKWIRYVRFGCDTKAQIKHCQKAIDMMRGYGYTGQIFLYTILQGDFQECWERISYWRQDEKVVCQAQPYIDFSGKNNPPQWQKDFAHWVNNHFKYRACEFEDFEPRKGFKCKEYFKMLKTRS